MPRSKPTVRSSPNPPLPSTDGAFSSAEWEAWIRASVGTEYHPAGTASSTSFLLHPSFLADHPAVLPLDKGGVVDVEMRVYGTQNLRIIDSSSPYPPSLLYQPLTLLLPVVPIGMSAHMAAPLYGPSCPPPLQKIPH